MKCLPPLRWPKKTNDYVILLPWGEINYSLAKANYQVWIMNKAIVMHVLKSFVWVNKICEIGVEFVNRRIEIDPCYLFHLFCNLFHSPFCPLRPKGHIRVSVFSCHTFSPRFFYFGSYPKFDGSSNKLVKGETIRRNRS